jgi:molybdate transport system substrate-binding protein
MRLTSDPSTTRRALRIVVAAVLALGACTAEAAEIRLLSAGAVKPVVTRLIDTFRLETGHTVTATFATVGELRQRLVAGEAADVAIVTDAALDALASSGILAGGERADIARVGVGVGVRDGTPLPDISTPEALKQALLAARSLVYMDPGRGATSGLHFASVLERLGIADAVRGKALLWPAGTSADAVAAGRAEICVQQISEIIPVKGVTLVGPLPRELQKVTVYSAAPVVRSGSREIARAFVSFLARPAFKPAFAAAGLDYPQ